MFFGVTRWGHCGGYGVCRGGRRTVPGDGTKSRPSYLQVIRNAVCDVKVYLVGCEFNWKYTESLTIEEMSKSKDEFKLDESCTTYQSTHLVLG